MNPEAFFKVQKKIYSTYKNFEHLQNTLLTISITILWSVTALLNTRNKAFCSNSGQRLSVSGDFYSSNRCLQICTLFIKKQLTYKKENERSKEQENYVFPLFSFQ